MELDPENGESPLSPEERVKMVESRYMSPDGQGNEAFAEFCLKYFPGVVMKVIGDTYPDSLDDVVQNATFKATRRLKTYTGNAKLLTWLFRIGTNESINLLRGMKAQKRGQQDPLDEILKNGEELTFATEPTQEGRLIDTELLESMFGVLNERQQRIVELRYLEGCTTREIADILGTTEGVARNALYEARDLMLARAGKKTSLPL
jgi:RNA polymerase sigma-70 factor (ECF subfamily)